MERHSLTLVTGSLVDEMRADFSYIYVCITIAADFHANVVAMEDIHCDTLRGIERYRSEDMLCRISV